MTTFGRAITLGVLVLAAGSACSSDPKESTGDGTLFFTVSLLNGDALIGKPIHMFDKLTFSVGRNGAVLKSVQCSSDSDANKVVKWNPSSNGSDSGNLTCQTNW
jgi:hypothetical protein